MRLLICLAVLAVARGAPIDDVTSESPAVTLPIEIPEDKIKIEERERIDEPVTLPLPIDPETIPGVRPEEPGRPVPLPLPIDPETIPGVRPEEPERPLRPIDPEIRPDIPEREKIEEPLRPETKPIIPERPSTKPIPRPDEEDEIDEDLIKLLLLMSLFGDLEDEDLERREEIGVLKSEEPRLRLRRPEARAPPAAALPALARVKYIRAEGDAVFKQYAD